MSQWLHWTLSVRMPARQLPPVVCTVLWVGLLSMHVQHVAGHGSKQITYIIPKQEKTCFSSLWTESEKIFFEYQVIRGGNKDVDVQIISPNGLVLYEKHRINNDEVTFIPQNGQFKFCFGNEFSQITEKVVTFNIRPAFTRSLSQETGDIRPMVKDSSLVSCDTIHEATSAALDFQRKYRIRESIGRHLAEKLNKMVTWWSVGQSVVVLICSIGQVLVLRTFFTEKRLSSKPAEGEPEEQQIISYT